MSPGSTNVPVDGFGIRSSATGDVLSSIRVSFATSVAGITAWSIYDVTATTVCYSSSSAPALGNNVATLTACNTASFIPRNQTHNFEIRFTAIPHAGTVGAFTSTAVVNLINGTIAVTADVAESVTVDNQPTAATSGLTGAADIGQVSLSWTNPGDTDLASILVVHDTSPITWTPSEGTTTYAVNQVVSGTVRVGCVVAPPTANCTDSSSLAEGTPYYFAAFALDGYGNYSAANTAGPYTPRSAFTAAGDPASGSTMPVVSIVNPMPGAVVKAPFKVQARVFSPPAGGNVGTVRLLVDGTAYATAMSPSLQYGTTTTSGIWEVTVSSITGGLRELRVEAANANNPGRSVLSSAFNVTASSATGDGKLLVRDNASQLCSDCHAAVMTHSSETTGSKYGSWAVSCRECHTPHQTHNLGLVQESIKPPELTAATTSQPVTFRARTGYAATSYASSTKDGPCQVCHTRTSVYRNDGNDYDPDTGALVGVSGSHNPTGPCTSCHQHTKGLGAICTDCHGTATRDSLASGGADAHQNAAPPLVASLAAVKVANGGVHVQHVNQATYRTNPLQCADCHTGASHQTNHQVDIKYTALAKTGGVATPLAPPEGALASTFATAPNCTNWCHGDGLPDAGGGVATWAWNGVTGGINCGSCHSAPPPVNTAGGDHPQNPTCANCHGAGYATTGISSTAKDTHIDGTVQKPTGCRACHGVLQPVGTTPPVATSTDPMAAPGYDATAVDTAGKNDASVPLTLGVGAHQAHVNPAGHGGSPMMSAKACGVCHAMPASDTDTSHANGATAWNWTNPANALTTTPTYSAGSCTNYCHSNAKPLGGTPSAPPFTWNATTAMQCTSCHDGAGAGTALSHAHQIHTGTYGYGCVRCHVNTATSDAAIVSGGGQHVDGTRDVDFDASGPNNSGGAYDYGLYKCSSTYCHSDGVDRTPGYASPASLAWNASSTCGSCHAEGSAMATNAHGAHVNHATTYGKTYGCQTCHYPTTTTGTTITTASNHVNALSDVEGATAGSLKYQDAANTTTNSCTTYCHSSGQAAGTGTPQYYSDMDWKLTTGLGCASCHGRYSPADPGFTTSYGAPNYVSGGEAVATANSHKKHVSSAGDCYVCHNVTANTTGDVIVNAGANHLDGNRQVSFDATKAGASAAYSNDVNKQCSNVSCHGAGSPKWGGPKQACGSCHLRTGLAGGDRNDFAGIDNGTSALVNSDEWTAVGHGSSAAAFLDAGEFGQAGITDRCVYCHDDQNSTANHKQAANPFRLRGKAAAGGVTAAYNTTTLVLTDAVCLNCHDLAANAPAGVDPDGAGGQPLVGPATTRISAYHAGAKHTGDNGGQRCWDCHDPHGDGTNIKMIGVDVLQYATDASGYAGGRAASTVSFTVRGVGGYTDTVGPAFNGVCQVCHSATDHLAGATGMTYWLANGTGLHNETLDCIGCHTHQQPPNNAFQGAGACSACHMGAASASTDTDRDEFPPNTSLGGKSLIDPEDWLLTGHGNMTTYSQSGNAGAKFPAPTQTVEPCYYCHAPDTALFTGGETSKHTDVATTNPFRLANTVGGTNKNGVCLVCHALASPGFDPDGSANLAYANINRTTSKPISATHYGAAHSALANGGTLCWDCHDPHGDYNYGVVAGGRAIAYMIQAKPTKSSADAWGNPSALAGVVVDFNKATSGVTTALEGTDYVGSGLTPPGVCQVCHTNTKYWKSDGSVATHENGGARCVSCHAHEQPATNAFKQATGCGDCHASPPANGKHAFHVGASTPAYGDTAPHATAGAYAYGCGKCHATPTSVHWNDVGGTTADPFVVQVAFDLASGTTPYTAGLAAQDVNATSGLVFKTSPGTCATYCHSDGQPLGAAAPTFKAPTWDAAAGSMTCTSCHGGDQTTGASKLTTNKHSEHITTSGAVGAGIACIDCHSTVVSGNQAILDRTLHVNGGAKNVGFTAKNGQTSAAYASPTCSAVYCHSNGRDPAFTDAGRYVSVAWNAGTATCKSCHGRGAGTTAAPDYADGATLAEANSHALHTGNLNDASTCERCHTNTVDATGVALKATAPHADGFRNVDVLAAYDLNGATANYNSTTKTCSAVSCHGSLAAPVWGTALGCTDCHGAPPAGGKHAKHDQTGTFAAYGDTANQTTDAAYGFACVTCHAGAHANATATGASALTAKSAEVTGGLGYTGGTTTTTELAVSGIYYGYYTDRSCTTASCHSNGGPLQSTGLNAALTYAPANWSATLGCGGCHGYGDAPGTMSAPHSKHIRNYGSGYQYACLQCHQTTTTAADTVSFKTKHADGVNDQVSFLSTLNPAPAGYTTTTFTCGSVYCHSDGKPLGAISPTYKSPKWTDASGSLGTTCTGCHGGDQTTGASKLVTNKHSEHITTSGAVGTGYGCIECHNTVVSGNQAILNPGGYALHVNGGAKNVGFQTKNGQTSSAYASPSCSAVYCHSNGRDPAVTDVNRYVSVAWNSGTATCAGCHGRTQNTNGAPDYTGATLAEANSHAIHTANGTSPATCQNCHTNTVDATGMALKAGAPHTDGFRNVDFLGTYDLNGATANYNSTTKTCSAVSCHGATAAPVWGAALACNACHGAAPTGGAHAKHDQAGTFSTYGDTVNQTTDASYAFACVTCHQGVHANSTQLGNTAATAKYVEVTAGLGYSGGGLTTATETGAGGIYFGYYTDRSCTTASCHTNGGPLQSTGLNAAVTYAPTTWATTKGCDGCHGYGDLPGTMSAPHAKHIRNYGNGYQYACLQCHQQTTTAANTVTFKTKHADGVNDQVSFLATLNPAPAAYSTTLFTCSSVYCHSDGGPLGAAPTYKSPKWTDAVGSLGTTCTGCHAGNTAATPKMSSGSHTAHVQNEGYACGSCHAGTVAKTSDLAITGYAKHVNGTADVQIDASYDGDGVTTANWTAATHTCNAITCHGTGAPVWGGTVKCGDCHLRTNLAGGDAPVYGGTFPVASTPMLSSDEWAAAGTGGHGQYVAFSGAANPCLYCHSSATGFGHKNTANPFRLRGASIADGTTGAYDAVNAVNAVCLNCHATGSNGVDPDGAATGYAKVNIADTLTAKKISANHYGASHGTTNNGGKRCWDCHDGHGDGNLHMIGKNVVQASTDDHAWTATRLSGIVFTASALATDYAVAGDKTKVCSACHVTTKYYRGVVGSTAHETTPCIPCHAHQQPPNKAFTGAGACSACHMGAASTSTDTDRDEFPPSTTTGGATPKSLIDPEDWLLTGHGNMTTYAQSGNPGAKFPAPTQTVEPCNYCHAPDTALVTGGETSSHADVATTNPFRLLNTSGGTNKNGVCLVCHKVGATGFDPDGAANLAYANINRTTSKAIDSTHAGAHHDALHDGGKLCWDCHDPHGDYNYGVVAGGRAIAYMIQAKPTKDSTDTAGWGASGTFAATVVDFNKTMGFDALNFDAGDYVRTATPWAGVCQVCHTSTANYTSAGANTTHMNTSTAGRCVACHAHENATATLAFYADPDCTKCHDVARGTRRAIVGEFKNAWSHKRSTSPATPANITVTKWDCIVCHMEGSTDATGSLSASHADGVINLRDPDTGNEIGGATWGGTGAGAYGASALTPFAKFSRNLGSATLEEPVRAIMVNQCLHCHDGDGAKAFAATQPLNSWATTQGFSAEKPFGQTILPTTAYTGVGVTANGVAGGVTNIAAAFASTNSSYHPILGKQNNWYAKLTRMVSPWNAATRGASVDLTSWGPLISCWDCHAPLGTVTTGTILTSTVTAHGGATTLRQPVWNGNATANLCVLCHSGYTVGSAHGSGSAFQTGTSAISSTILTLCSNCHSSGTNARPTRGEDAHGFNALPTTGTKTGRWSGASTGSPAQVNAKPYAFLRNTVTFTDYQPLVITGSTYTPTCVVTSGGNGVSCKSGTFSGTYPKPGGTY